MTQTRTSAPPDARTVNYRRLLLAGVLFALIPVATEIAALATLAGVNAMPWTMIACETARYDERATGCATA